MQFQNDVFLKVPASDKNGNVNLWIRTMEGSNPHRIPGTEGSRYAFWSGDNKFIGFFANGKLIKSDPATGFSQTLCDVSDERGGAWNQNGVILFSPNPGDGLYRISSAGGVITRVTSLNLAAQETTHRFPFFLPDGNHFLFYVKAQKAESGIYIGSLDSQEKSFLLKSDRSAIYSSGYLLFQRANTLFAQAFDPKKLKLSGEPIPLSENIWYEPVMWGSRGMAVAESSLLAYIEGTNRTKILWFDRNGNQEGQMSAPDLYAGAPSFSPDGKKFTMQVLNGVGSDIWLFDTEDGSRSRLTFAASYNHSGTFRWSADGTRILFSSSRTGPYSLYVRNASGAGNDELLYESKNWCLSEDWSPDNQYIIFDEVDPKTKYDLWILRLPEKKAFPFLLTDANEANARFSPDGKWITYCSDESGRPEIYVQPFLAKTGGKWQISTNGGFIPKWSKDGKEIFYLSTDNQIMSSSIKVGLTFESTTPKPLFLIHPFTAPRIAGGYSNIFEPTADGRRFAVHASLTDSPPSITVVLNWPVLLNQRK